MISTRSRTSENKGTCRIVWWDKSTQECLLFLSKQTAGSKITALCKQQRVCWVSSKQNRQIGVSVGVYLSPLWISQTLPCTARRNGLLTGAWAPASPNSLSRTENPAPKHKNCILHFLFLFNSHLKNNKKSCISRSIFLRYALRKALLKDQFYSWNWKTGGRTMTLFIAAGRGVGFSKAPNSKD